MMCKIECRKTCECVICGRVVASERTKANCGPVRNFTPGPGYHLSQLLSPIKHASQWLRLETDCSCQKYAAEMDRNGVEWCEANIETIIGWLREGAEKHGLPFSGMVARWIVKRAIRQAKNNS
jgi:hypothetical protein